MSAALAHRVTLQSRQASIDSLGQAAGGLVDIATVWAEVVPVAAREFEAAEQMRPGATVRVKIRARADVAALAVVLWRGVAWDVVGVPLPDPRDRGMLRFEAVSGVRDAAQ